ncbi:MAG: hypothetical protein OQJ98_01960 [Candidatus Pacebacteria bacterium]|nr:hypothetical protein [Candidatus Paceibacterota bacterium]
MDIYNILVFLHIAGVILGVGGATLAEVFYLMALKDGDVDASERRMMHANYRTLRVGLVLIIFSGIAMVWWLVSVEGHTWPLHSAKLWAKEVMTAVIIINAVLISKRWVPMWLGASLSFTSWWAATLLGTWRDLSYSFGEVMIGYGIAVFVVAAILESIKKWYLKK